MPEKKLTETEILKAAECCKSGDCVSCPLSSNRYESKCKDILFEAVIDLINRKNEENERLIKECGNQSTLWCNHFESIFETAKETARAEAIKEVLEKVKKLIVMCYYDLGDIEDTMLMEKDIDQIAKEMGVDL